MASTRTVDFIVIGAQKGGTTSLFRYLRAHPQIHMPLMKEVSFFSSDQRYRQGIDWYMNHFVDAQPNQIVGEASPQYMMNPAVPARIQAHYPDVKLVAVLRDPIERAYSSYRMLVRLGGERRPVAEALAEVPEFNPENLFTPADYTGMSLYGAILRHWLQYFSRDQIHIVFTEALAAQPETTMRALLAFLGASPDVLPENLHHHYHRSGRPRYRAARWAQRLLASLEKLLPRRYRGLAFMLEQWNTQPVHSAPLSVDLRQKLVRVFREDVALLEHLFGVEVPWPELRTPA